NNSSKQGSEPLGTTIYEAMACEKIVLASNTGGSPEIIENGIDGFLFDADEQDQLKSVLEKVVTLIEEGSSTIQKSARRKAEGKFNIHEMITDYNKIVDELEL